MRTNMPGVISKLLFLSLLINSSFTYASNEDPQYWRAILGDICQLPNFPKATADPTRYVECVKQNADSNDRSDLGIWLLRECLPGYEFVASARRCKTTSTIRRQQKLCNSNESGLYDFCPTIHNNQLQFTVEEIKQGPRKCTCPNGESNCVCPLPEILQPVKVNVTSYRFKRQINNCNCNQYTQTTAAPIYQNDGCNCNNMCTTTTTQQTYCPQQDTTQTVIQPQECQLVSGGVQNAKYQGICSWMVDPLAVDPESKTHFLQCQPAPKNLFCGRWQRMPCAPGTVFSVNDQVCVWDSSNIIEPGPIPTPNPNIQQPGPLPTTVSSPILRDQCNCNGGVKIGNCNNNYQCPGQSVCQVPQQNPVVQTQAPISNESCLIGINSIISSVKNNPKTMTELGSQMSESCDSLPSKQDRLGCREIFSNHMNELFNAFVNEPEVSPEALCKQIEYC
uniref:Chitin-binding type-2 domain-containing protein n=1 Tax=Strongyloides stercoralis TaxID=6248 RepID=A0AAF5CVZ5_STRER